MNAIDFHNAIAARFDRKYASSLAFGERFRVWTAMFDRYVNAADRVLDLGCGPGIFSQHLASKGCRVTGIDGSVAMIRICRRKKPATTARYVVESLPLPNPDLYAQQDVVIASSLLEYLEDMNAVLQQIEAMLRPNGLLIASMPNRLSLYRRVERGLFAITGYPRYAAHMRSVSTEALFNGQLRTLGFEVLETTYFSSYDPLSRLLKPVLPRQYVNSLFVGVYRKTG